MIYDVIWRKKSRDRYKAAGSPGAGTSWRLSRRRRRRRRRCRRRRRRPCRSSPRGPGDGRHRPPLPFSAAGPGPGRRAAGLTRRQPIPIVLGVFLNFCYDLQFSIIGTLYATLGVLVTSFYQVLVSTKQHELQMDSMQLLYYQAPLSAFILLLVVPVLEPVQATLIHDWTVTDLLMVSASCIIAFFVNISIYWIIGNTSPLTYNMVGHLKFCMTVLGGVLIFEDTLHINQGIGVLLTVMGITAYAHVKIKEHKPPVRSLDNECEILIRKM